MGETDGSGQFDLALPPGPVTLTFHAEGHFARTVTERIATGERLTVEYALTPTRVNPYETVVRDDAERMEIGRVKLSHREITEVPGTMGDPFRAVMLMPGVAGVASGISYPVVRGMAPAGTGYFVDGVRVPQLYHLFFGPAVVHPEFLESLEFTPGPVPARAARLLGGAIEATTRRSHDGELHAQASVDLLNASAFVDDAIASTGTSITLAGRYSYSGLIATRLSSALAPPSDARISADFWDYQGRIEQRIGAGTLRLLALGSSDSAGLSTDVAGTSQFQLGTEFHRGDLRYRHPLGTGEVEAGATWGTQRLAITSQGTGSTSTAHYVLDQTELSARTRWTGTLGPAFSLETGAELTGRISHVDAAASDATTDVTSEFRAPRTVAVFAGVYGEVRFRPTDAFTVALGVRAEDDHLVYAGDNFSVDPRASLRWAVRDDLVIKAAAAWLHQPPTVTFPLPVLEDAALAFGLQSAVETSAGVEWRPLPGLELAADGYWNTMLRTVEFPLLDALDATRALALPGVDPGVPGRAYGVELLVRHPIGAGWFGWLSYAYQRSERLETFTRIGAHNELLGSTRAWVPYAFEQQHVLNAAVSWQVGAGWTLGAVGHFNTGAPQSGELRPRSEHAGEDLSGTPAWIVDDRDHVAPLPSFVRFDVRASKTWLLRHTSIELYLDVQNVSLQPETLAVFYERSQRPDGSTQLATFPVRLPLIVPMLGAKVTY